MPFVWFFPLRFSDCGFDRTPGTPLRTPTSPGPVRLFVELGEVGVSVSAPRIAVDFNTLGRHPALCFSVPSNRRSGIWTSPGNDCSIGLNFLYTAF